MPVAKPAYGRKPGPSVVPATPISRKAAAKAKEDAARQAAIAAAVVTTFTG